MLEVGAHILRYGGGGNSYAQVDAKALDQYLPVGDDNPMDAELADSLLAAKAAFDPTIAEARAAYGAAVTEYVEELRERPMELAG